LRCKKRFRWGSYTPKKAETLTSDVKKTSNDGLLTRHFAKVLGVHDINIEVQGKLEEVPAVVDGSMSPINFLVAQDYHFLFKFLFVLPGNKVHCNSFSQNTNF
jgi:hypothetical protein